MVHKLGHTVALFPEPGGPVHMRRVLQQIVLHVGRQRHVQSFGAGFVSGLVATMRLGMLILGSMVGLLRIVRPSGFACCKWM